MPEGLSGEVFTFVMHEQAQENTARQCDRKPGDREHVTPYMRRQEGDKARLILSSYAPPMDYDFSIDTPKDYAQACFMYQLFTRKECR